MDLNQICSFFSPTCHKVCCLTISFVLTTPLEQPFVQVIHRLVADLVTMECKEGLRTSRELAAAEVTTSSGGPHSSQDTNKTVLKTVIESS
jgi:hypothetical protein